jgi:hypothetical protein
MLTTPFTTFAVDCGSFLGIPTWYEYLDSCTDPNISALNDIWLVGLALLDMLLSLAVIVGIFFFLFGAIQMITARGNPESIASARSSIVNALIGIGIAFLATTFVSFIAGRLA